MFNMRSTRRAARRGVHQCLLEPLERRRLLSANVSVSVTNGELYLTGDSANDSLVIDQVSLSATQFRVSSGDGLTTINGKTSASVFSQVSSIVIDTGAGDDTVTIQNAAVAAKVQFTDPSGNQVFTLNNVTIGGDVAVTTAGGDNSILIGNSTITGNVTVNAGAVFSSQSRFYGSCSATTAAEEIVTLTNSAVGNNVIITNATGQTLTSIQARSLVGGNVTVTNSGDSTDQGWDSDWCGCCGLCGQCGTESSSSADMFTLGNSTVSKNVSITNAGDDNQTDVDGSIIVGSLTVTNSGNSSSSSSCGCYGCCDCGGDCTTSSGGTDVFTLNGSAVLGNVTVSNVSGNATTTVDGSSIVGSLTVTNTGGDSSQSSDCWYECGDCCGSDCSSASSSPAGDVFALSASAVVGNVTLSNSSVATDTDIESSAILGSLALSNTLSSGSQSCGCWSQCTRWCGTCGGCWNQCTACGTDCGNCHVQCGGSCTVSTASADGIDVFTLNASAVIGNAAISNPNGTTSITFDASAVVGGTTIRDGNGTAALSMVGNSTLVGNLTLTIGAGVIKVDVTAGSVIFGNATLKVPSGATITITPSQVGGTLTVN